MVAEEQLVDLASLARKLRTRQITMDVLEDQDDPLLQPVGPDAPSVLDLVPVLRQPLGNDEGGKNGSKGKDGAGGDGVAGADSGGLKGLQAAETTVGGTNTLPKSLYLSDAKDRAAAAAAFNPETNEFDLELDGSIRGVMSRQVITSFMFADVVSYSKLGELEVLVFIKHFLGAVQRLIDAMPKRKKPRLQNTWGDAITCIWPRPKEAGEFALMLSDMVTRTPWERLGLPSSLNIRISLHAAPVHSVVDPVLGKRNYSGVHTSRGARIEPITPPGSVYCTQAFAAISETMDVKTFTCDPVGQMSLAKKYGAIPVYHCRWSAPLFKRKGKQRLLQSAIGRSLRAAAGRAKWRASQTTVSSMPTAYLTKAPHLEANGKADREGPEACCQWGWR